MNLSSILLKSIIVNSDIETWAECEKHYFPSEYAQIWNVLHRYVEEHSTLPSFEAINLFVRDGKLREKFNSLAKAETLDIDSATLLEYLKNEYTQVEIMSQLETYLENTIAMESASENIEALQNIVLDVETKVQTKPASENMQKIELIRSPEDIARNISLTLNRDYDSAIQFYPNDLILFGGKRGAGKSVTCANIATNMFEQNHSVVYFTIEMTAQSILQRCCAIATGVPAAAIRNGNLSLGEYQAVAEWWASRFEDGERALHSYLSHHNFREFHKELTQKPLRETQLDVVYSPTLTLANIRMELDKKMKRLQPKVIIVDYMNQVKRGHTNSRMGQYDWTEQIEVSKALKTYAQEYGVLVISPYQIDASGEARFAKGILDAADAAYTLDTHTKEDNAITFNCVKMRENDEASFTSIMDWVSLKIGPGTGVLKSDGDEVEPYEEIA